MRRAGMARRRPSASGGSGGGERPRATGPGVAANGGLCPDDAGAGHRGCQKAHRAASSLRASEANENTGIRPCIPAGNFAARPVRYDRRRAKWGSGIKIMFGMLKDWRRVDTRYDRCPKVFLSAAALAATVLFWL